MSSALSFPGGEIDCSGWLASHAGDVTPSTRGEGLRLSEVAKRVNRLLELAWNRAPDRVECDGQRLVLVPSTGIFTLVDDLTFAEAAELIDGPFAGEQRWTPVPAERRYVDETGAEQ